MKELGDSVADVFAGAETIIHFKDKSAKVDEKKLAALLKKHKLTLKDLERDDDYIL